MKSRFKLGAVVLATLTISGCDHAKQSDLDALKAEVVALDHELNGVPGSDSLIGHRAASKKWADSINVLLYNAEKCIVEDNCGGGIDPETPPPANTNW